MVLSIFQRNSSHLFIPLEQAPVWFTWSLLPEIGMSWWLPVGEGVGKTIYLFWGGKKANHLPVRMSIGPGEKKERREKHTTSILLLGCIKCLCAWKGKLQSKSSFPVSFQVDFLWLFFWHSLKSSYFHEHTCLWTHPGTHKISSGLTHKSLILIVCHSFASLFLHHLLLPTYTAAV